MVFRWLVVRCHCLELTMRELDSSSSGHTTSGVPIRTLTKIVKTSTTSSTTHIHMRISLSRCCWACISYTFDHISDANDALKLCDCRCEHKNIREVTGAESTEALSSIEASPSPLPLMPAAPDSNARANF